MKKRNLITLCLGLIFAQSGHAIELTDQAAVTPRGVLSLKALENGMTLYVFDPDQGTSTSACNAECAEKWPPILLTSEEVSSLSAASGLGVIKRSNGLRQLTLSGRPLYTFFADRLPRDAKGDGLGNVWHVIESK